MFSEQKKIGFTYISQLSTYILYIDLCELFFEIFSHFLLIFILCIIPAFTALHRVIPRESEKETSDIKNKEKTPSPNAMSSILFTSPRVNKKRKFDSSFQKETDTPNETLDRSHLLLSNGEKVDIQSSKKSEKEA